MVTDPQHLRDGAAAEARALEYLQDQGLRLVARNWRCRSGELDLIMRDGESLVFVEVRYRRRRDYGGALASIDRRKRQRLLRAARTYLQVNRASDRPCRFDVVALGPEPESLQWLKNAIQPES